MKPMDILKTSWDIIPALWQHRDIFQLRYWELPNAIS